MTASLTNFLYSLVAGGFVVAAITTAVIVISRTDRIAR